MINGTATCICRLYNVMFCDCLKLLINGTATCICRLYNVMFCDCLKLLTGFFTY